MSGVRILVCPRRPGLTNMFELWFPIPFLIIGIATTFYRDRAAGWFCRLGRAIWKLSTFGLTDMAPFYQEEKARQTFRLLGPVFLCAGLFLLWVSIQSFNGPGSFAAMREARLYLERTHGTSAGWSFSSEPADTEGTVIVQYRYANRDGTLRATWSRDHYEFTEVPPASR